MKHLRLLMFAAIISATALPSSGQETVDYKKYPDYSTRVKSDLRLLRPQSATVGTRPDHVNNADSIYFPPVISQAGGSCGSASRIAYMFTYEINRLRGLDGSLDENRYPTHFTWLLTNSNSGKDGMAIANGIPNVVTYGGPLYSYTFGNQDTSDPDFGWMQGYDKWYSAMFNRLERTANFPLSVETEAGREAVKNWIWNHNGNANYPGGGICGIGVASGGTWLTIPQTTANDDAGVTGMYYVSKWGTSIDHALTIVGYDDRIEFDLDDNGVAGETDKDEVGAWIVVNSWGSSWCNNGFIYCPYKNAVTSVGGSYYMPEIYYIRRDYRPLRVMRILMDYTKRSELKLSAGISTNLDAEEPESTVEFEHFKYAGDGDGDGVDAETPMLGRWADGLHTEPMEFGYDLTDLSAGFDTRRPLKYFFIIESKSSASGSGTIRECSLIDYEFDHDGIEVPFDLGSDGVSIQTKGNKTIVSVTVAGEAINAPRNLTLTADSSGITWEAPVASSYTLKGYNIYRNDTLENRVDADVLTYTPEQTTGTYRVCAVYAYGTDELLSAKTNTIAGKFYGSTPTNNYIRQITNSGFRVKDILNETQKTFTIEYWIRPSTCIDYNQQVGPGWSKNFMIHTTAQGEFVAGWSTSNRVTTAAKTLRAGIWTHAAIVVDGTEMRVYINGEKAGTASSGGTEGIGGFGDLDFGVASSTSGLNGSFDEVRIWNTARTEREIQSMMYSEVADPANTPGLLVELKFSEVTSSTFVNGTGRYVVEKLTGTQSRATNNKLFVDSRELKADFSLPDAPYYTGTLIEPVNEASGNATSFLWEVKEGTSTRTLNVETPSFIFDSVGEKTISLTVTAGDSTATSSQTINVEALPVPAPSFSCAETVPLGSRISFINTTSPTDGCSFAWSMPGAETESATTINAATSYQSVGKHTVSLTVTNAAGSTTVSREIEVTPIAPEAAFTATPATILKGNTVQLTDDSKYAPTSYAWTVTNDAYHLVANTQNPEFTFNDPGVYSVQLDVANDAGQSSVTKKRGIVVCNADGQTGLNFTGDETVTFNNPLDLTASDGQFTIDWWMYAKSNSKTCHHIGGSKSDILITTTSAGALRLTMGTIANDTEDGIVVPSEWHHYAITFAAGDAHVYKDGQLVQTFYTPWMDGTYPKMPTTFSLGGTDAPLNAVIDEFRIWTTCLSAEELRAYANQPIEDVATAEAEHGLVLYYNFNQSSGSVQDATSGNHFGTRAGFGPEGDAWASSFGVFCLSKATREDVTAQYLTNYKAPFLYSEVNVSTNKGAQHLYGLLQDDETSRWKIENAVEAEDGTLTGICVDTKNSDYMAMITKSYNFESAVTDHKVYQTITLPAGHYVFGVERADTETDEESYIVVNEGDTLLSTANVAKAMAYTAFNSSELDFTVYKDTKLSLGILFNTRGQITQHFNRFYLEKKISNDDFTWTGINGTTADGYAAVTYTPVAGGVSLTAGMPTAVSICNLAGVNVFAGIVEGTRFVALPAGVYVAAGHKFVVTSR